MKNYEFKPGDECKLRVYEGDELVVAKETFNYFNNLIRLDQNMESRDDIPFNYKPTKVTMMTKGIKNDMSYIVKIEGVLI